MDGIAIGNEIEGRVHRHAGTRRSFDPVLPYPDLHRSILTNGLLAGCSRVRTIAPVLLRHQVWRRVREPLPPEWYGRRTIAHSGCECHRVARVHTRATGGQREARIAHGDVH